MVSKQWIRQEIHEEHLDELVHSLQISPVVARILVNRGITTVEAARTFFACELSDLPDPFLMLGMDKAVERIRKALVRDDPILIYGDYDADGQTATALLVLGLRHLAKSPEQIAYYLPDRLGEGYGLNRDALALLSKRTSLIITVDCGISALDEVAYAKELGLDLIISDHHEPGPVLPEAFAIINPKQRNCPYPHKDLAGVGVASKLLQGLGLDPKTWYTLLDLVALGTVADLVPLRGENRILVHHGLKQMAQTINLGLQALLEVAEVDKPTAGALGFRLGPRLNAAGRLGDPTRGVRLLLTKDLQEARELALELHQENLQRQELENGVLEEALDLVERYQLHKRSSLVVWGKGWHQGVIGIVASRLVERYYLPTVVISLQEGQGVASARSIAGLDLYQTLTECAPLLSKYGGHTMAAGLSLPLENVVAFQELFERLCKEKMRPEDFIPKLYIDSFTSLKEVTPELIGQLSRLEPHGMGNPAPLLQANVNVIRTKQIGQDKRHLQLIVQDKTLTEVQAIAFGAGEEQGFFENYAEGVDLAFVPNLNEWRNEKTVQLQIKDWKRQGNKINYVQYWMTENYPWSLGLSFFQSRALLLLEQDYAEGHHARITDLRGAWDKVTVIQQHRSLEEPTLILVNTPAKVLEVCRYLRIRIPGGSQYIGFEHELMTAMEQGELGIEPPNWLVSTGYGLKPSTWTSVWLWEPPLTKELYTFWSGLLKEDCEFVAVYGPKEVRELQNLIAENYPERSGLARIYGLLRTSSGKVELTLARERLSVVGLLGALPMAMGVFSELGLWEVQDAAIIYLPTPMHKLDLEQSVLYNKGTTMRKQSSEYLKRSMERGFFQDGLKIEN